MSNRPCFLALLGLALILVSTPRTAAAPPPGMPGDQTPIFGPNAPRACPEPQFPSVNKRWIQGTKDIAGVQLNGKWVCFPDAQPGIVNNRVLVPVRFVSEALGATVQWDDQARKVTVIKQDRRVELTIGQSEVTVNGTLMSLDVAPVIHFDRTFVPLRLVSEALGAKVEWDQDNYLVRVTTEGQ